MIDYFYNPITLYILVSFFSAILILNEETIDILSDSFQKTFLLIETNRKHPLKQRTKNIFTFIVITCVIFLSPFMLLKRVFDWIFKK